MPAGTAPNISTFDAVPQPYRPGLPDFNGAALVDHAKFPPDPSTMPTGPLLNTTAKTLISLGSVSPIALLSVTGGNPATVSSFRSVSSTAVAPTVTRNGVGDHSFTWPGNTFPAPAALPVASLNVQLGANNYAIGVVAIANGFRVTTAQNAALADLSFTVIFF